MSRVIQGIVQGTTVVLEQALPELEGQRVQVTLEPASEEENGAPPMATLIGRSIVASAPDGRAELRFEASERFANRFGTIQGGMLAAMLDSALGIAVTATLSPDQQAVTVEMSTRYFRPAQPGPIQARASVLHRGSTLAHAQADLFDPAGTHLAHATASMRISTRSR